MKLSLPFAVLLSLAAGSVFADEGLGPLCSRGKIPVQFQGDFVEINAGGSNGSVSTLSENRLSFVPRGYLRAASCVVEGFRVITFTDDTNTDYVSNVAVFLNERKDLIFLPLSKHRASSRRKITDYLQGKEQGLRIYTRIQQSHE